jgi:CheY-like chemotaxis protein
MIETLRPILAAEDEESDRIIMRLAFQRANLRFPLVIVGDGAEAVDYLSGKGRYAERIAHPFPVLVILDLKMPRMSGFDVLGWMALQPELKEIPAMVLSSSADESDIAKARQLGARDYFVKPHSLDMLIKIAHEIQARWLTVATGDASMSPAAQAGTV